MNITQTYQRMIDRASDLPLFQKFNQLNPNVRGAIWLLGSGIFFTAMSVLIKQASQEFSSFQVAFFRALFGFIVIAPFALRHGVTAVKTARPGLHLFRGVVGACVMMAMFYAVARLPLADVTALSFTRPIFLIPLAVLFLGEIVRVRRWTATAVGFIGVLIMVRPGSDGIDPAVLVALGASIGLAVITVCVKKLSETEAPATMLFWSSIMLTLCTAFPAWQVWQTPTWSVIGMAVAMGACGTVGQAMLIRGYAVGEATAITPFDYSRLIYSAIAGFIFFTEVPDIMTLAGAAVIVGSSIYIARREAKRNPDAAPNPTPMGDQAGSANAALENMRRRKK